MIAFGSTLRAAREAKGLSASNIAESTHMMIQTVEALETEDFSRIIAPIYGRGFVKLYCEAVGLEPKPMIDTFMELYTGKSDGSATRAEPIPEPSPSLAQEKTISRYAGNLPSEPEPPPVIPFADLLNWRIAALAGAVVVILVLVSLAVKGIYDATMTEPEAAQPPSIEETAKVESAPTTDGEPRKPLPVKPFYIDSDHSNEPERNK